MILAPDRMLYVFIKSRMMRGGKGVVNTGRRKVYIAFWLGKLKEGDHLGELNTDGRILLKLVFQK